VPKEETETTLAEKPSSLGNGLMTFSSGKGGKGEIPSGRSRPETILRKKARNLYSKTDGSF